MPATITKHTRKLRAGPIKRLTAFPAQGCPCATHPLRDQVFRVQTLVCCFRITQAKACTLNTCSVINPSPEVTLLRCLSHDACGPLDSRVALLVSHSA